MIKGGYSNHAAGLQFLMIVLLVLAGIMVFTLIGLLLVPVLFPISLQEVFVMLQDGRQLPTGPLIFFQGLSSLGMFLVPALLAAYLFSYDGPSYLGLAVFPKHATGVVALLVVVAFSANSLSDVLYRLAKNMPWPQSLSSMEQMINSSEIAMNEQVSTFLAMGSPLDFVRMFFVMAILPAVCEEALFRGVLQPVLKRFANNVHIGVLLTSALFAFIHLQFYTFLPILALGLVLGYVKEWSGSLWPPMLLHLLNNGAIVVAVYFFEVDYQKINEVGTGWNLQYTGPGLLVFAISLYALYWLLTRQTKSPIQKDRAE